MIGGDFRKLAVAIVEATPLRSQERGELVGLVAAPQDERGGDARRESEEDPDRRHASGRSPASSNKTRNLTRPRDGLFKKKTQLFNRLGAVVHLQMQLDVVMQPHAAFLLDDDERCGFLTALVAAGSLPSLERSDE